MILVDTSIWIEFLDSGLERLATELEVGRVLTHAFVIGELACGNLRNRTRTLALLAGLPQTPHANDNEVLTFIEAHRLMGHGIGFVDAHLLASAVLSDNARLWTRDKRLRNVAQQLEISYPAPTS